MMLEIKKTGIKQDVSLTQSHHARTGNLISIGGFSLPPPMKTLLKKNGQLQLWRQGKNSPTFPLFRAALLVKDK